jgi:hypothetical protein
MTQMIFPACNSSIADHEMMHTVGWLPLNDEIDSTGSMVVHRRLQ